MAKRKRKQLGQILKEEMELITEGDVQEALAIQRENGGAIGQILVDMELISKDDVLLALAAQAGLDMIDLATVSPSNEVLSKINQDMAFSYKIVPVSFEDKKLTVALADPSNISVLDDLKFGLGYEIEALIAPEDQIIESLGKFYDDEAAAARLAAQRMTGDADEGDLADIAQGEDGGDPTQDVDAAPVVRLLNAILKNAIHAKASDIHFEPYEDTFRIRYRVDGVLYEMEAPPKELAATLVARVKVMSDLDIAETRLPQDGRIELTIAGRPVDLRVSTLPTMFGESCVMRILDRSVVSLDIDNVGLRENEKEMMKAMVDKPNGIVLVTGPTGSGKTTTLYSCLNYANDVGIKIITTEDPVEYDLEGIVQVQINPEVEVTYAKCLRAILRQDPDKILVGEIRDSETAGIAVEAALTGHLVLSTLHTNDAPSTVTRVIDVGVEDFLVAAVLEGIVAQRLVRRICTDCKEYYEPNQEHMMELNLKWEEVEGKQFAFGGGCAECNYTGFRGRMAIFEIMTISDRVRQMIMDKASTAELRKQARREGMRSLREAGVLAILDGKTTREEVLRETLMAE